MNDKAPRDGGASRKQRHGHSARCCVSVECFDLRSAISAGGRLQQFQLDGRHGDLVFAAEQLAVHLQSDSASWSNGDD